MLELIIILLFIILSAIFSASETAYTSLSIIQIQDIRKKGKSGISVYNLVQSPSKLIITILIGNNISNIVASTLTTKFVLEKYGNSALAISTGLITIIVLIFAEILPKQIAILNNEIIALSTSFFLKPLIFIFTPLIYIINKIIKKILNLFKVKTSSQMTKESIKNMLSLAGSLGILKNDSRIFMQKMLDIDRSLLHSIGLMHITILENMGNKISLKDKNFKEHHKLKIEHLEKNINIAKNLFRIREDISAITKMIINGQKDYLDATGHPQLKINKFIHELVRIFCIVDTYDELVNPIIIKESANPLETVKFLIENSGKYYWSRKEPKEQTKNKKFDIKMLENFLTILAPFDYGQIVDVNKKNNNENLFQAAVLEYKMSIAPNLSIINKKNQTYKIEEIIMDRS